MIVKGWPLNMEKKINREYHDSKRGICNTALHQLYFCGSSSRTRCLLMYVKSLKRLEKKYCSCEGLKNLYTKLDSRYVYMYISVYSKIVIECMLRAIQILHVCIFSKRVCNMTSVGISFALKKSLKYFA